MKIQLRNPTSFVNEETSRVCLHSLEFTSEHESTWQWQPTGPEEMGDFPSALDTKTSHHLSPNPARSLRRVRPSAAAQETAYSS